jgi:hypothetical protein
MICTGRDISVASATRLVAYVREEAKLVTGCQLQRMWDDLHCITAIEATPRDVTSFTPKVICPGWTDANAIAMRYTRGRRAQQETA